MSKLIMSGRNSVIEAVKFNFPIEKIWVTNQKDKDLILKLKKQNFKIEIIDKNTINQQIKENHQNFVAFIKNIDTHPLEVIYKDKPMSVLILDHIQDPHNFGAIIRTANAAGVKHIIYPKDRAADITSTVLKISSGGFVDMKFIKVASISAAITSLKKNNFWIYASNLNENAHSYNQVNYNFPLALVVGNEQEGISKSTLKMSDMEIYINQRGSVQSINVSVATGILLFKINEFL
ncbi:23S rRNA (guanosine(2251)-2'-O)-methyltransferase RlmB [Mycoplasmopsis ciconiae]|uniref:23S rRNA (Guanosine(2251)-2'-O)-methyltransferase RlmB n=1 Tax=Mycoplasmopsis ciconiae TaxID=561067 RepID=A0ABU7MKK5_9BACT|nr:23S rRNA (guanosine(2251)-2'-O)-methyltransferase RlmB [Mycoplasmopsis ciconiae]